MANKQISQLTAKPSPVASTDQFGIDDNSSDSWKITVANLQTYFTTLYLTLSGGTMAGNLTLNGDPSTALMAATKQYVDALISSIEKTASCVAASTGALTATYSNGTAGVGATLTNAGAMAAFSLDGLSPTSGQRVLIKNQGSTFQNGIYTVTTVGSGAANWVLTRSTDFDQASEILAGTTVNIDLGGTANGLTAWMQTATVVTIGTDPITFSQFSANPGAFLQVANNLSDVASQAVAFRNLIPTTEVTGTSASMTTNRNYIASNAGLVTLTIPATFSVGDKVEITGKGAGGWLIAQAAGQQIHLGSSSTTIGVGGSLASTNRRDSLSLTGTVANTEWTVQGGPQGTITVV